MHVPRCCPTVSKKKKKENEEPQVRKKCDFFPQFEQACFSSEEPKVQKKILLKKCFWTVD
jgi:hypothetical protein